MIYTKKLKLRLEHRDIVKLFKHSERTLLSMVERGIIVPLINSGRGGHRIYDIANVMEFGLSEFFHDACMKFEHIKPIVRDPEVQFRLHNQYFNFFIITATGRPSNLAKQGIDDSYFVIKDTREEAFDELEKLLYKIPTVRVFSVHSLYNLLIQNMTKLNFDL